ncbi:Copper-binding protein CopC (methionine-rich) [Marinococcus luteus]|uniref:Copper-binding protein CopC (Methionine-rich) n=1 Tax=Marinococcus luteus TaxID=1122204 RepID=A0A1H2T8M9_9BACI|nr:copper resistance protein CopC [Marinococcus luteus]SDW39644.1 Copper-binding protein CopC (methionine-rich) [Marinococcus luteus]
MKYRIFGLLAVLFFIASPYQAVAAPTLESSSPEDGDSVLEVPERLELTFDTEIDRVEDMYLLVETGDEIEMSDPEISDDGRTVVSYMETVLENGNYVLNYSVTGADGETVQGGTNFSLNSNQPFEERQQELEERSGESSLSDADREAAEEAEEAGPNIPGMVAMGVLGLAIVSAFTIILWKNREHKK